MLIILGVILLLVLLLVGVGYLYGSRHFVVEESTLYFDDLPDEFDGYRICQFSDFHAFAFHRGHEEDVQKVVDLINAQHCDLIVFTGDLVTIQADELDGFMDQLSRLSAPDGVISIMGNHDYAMYQRRFSKAQRRNDIKDLYRRQHDLGWQLLLNEHTSVRRGDDSLVIIGVENDGTPPHFPRFADLKKAMNGIDDQSFQIMLSHDPTHWRRSIIKDTDVQLTLSGHTHAGQLRVFGWSPVTMVYKEWSGVYENEKTDSSGRIIRQKLHISDGVGCVPIPFRVGAWPEINVLTLRKS
ncbi:MAG: metallophosphoesterase [Bacteroidaceae bacterium]|nr:metallophosphoesterase [Bacteroidaceae bacterium]